MKKFIFGFFLLGIQSLAHSDTITSGVGLLKPSTGIVDVTRSWADKINSNFDIIGSTLNARAQDISNISASTGTLLTLIQTTASALTTYQSAVITSTQTIANSTGVVVNGTLVSSFVFTGSGQSVAFNGSTVTITISGGGGGGGGGGSLSMQQGTGGTWIAMSSIAVKLPLQFDPFNSSGTLTLPATAQVTLASATFNGTITTTDTVRVGTMSVIGSSICWNGSCFQMPADGTNGFFLKTDGNRHLSFAVLPDVSGSTTARLNNLDSSTSALTNLILSIDTETVSGGGGGVKSLFLRTTLDSNNSYYLALTTPSQNGESTKNASVASANGLVLISSHATVMTGLGEDLTAIPAGFWQFAIFAKIDSFVGQTDLVVDISTMDNFNNNQGKIVSDTITNINTTNTQLFAGESLSTFTITISTSDRLLVNIYAKTTSALARTVTISYEGVTNASRIGTPIERQPTFISLSDTPSSYIGAVGKFPMVNNTATGMGFVDIGTTAITNAAISAINSTYTVANAALQQGYVIVSTNISPNISISSLTAGQFTSTGNVTLPQGTITASTGVFTATPLAMTSGGTGLSRTNFKDSFTIPPAAWNATKSSGTALALTSETVVNLFNFDQMQFQNNTTAYAYVTTFMPGNYDGSTVTFKYSWSGSSSTIGQTSSMTLQCVGFKNGDGIDTAYGTAVGVNSDFTGANNVQVSSESAPVTCAGSPGSNRLMGFKLGRLGSDGYAAFLQILGIQIIYTKNSFSQ